MRSNEIHRMFMLILIAEWRLEKMERTATPAKYKGSKYK